MRIHWILVKNDIRKENFEVSTKENAKRIKEYCLAKNYAMRIKTFEEFEVFMKYIENNEIFSAYQYEIMKRIALDSFNKNASFEEFMKIKA